MYNQLEKQVWRRQAMLTNMYVPRSRMGTALDKGLARQPEMRMYNQLEKQVWRRQAI